MGAADEGIEGVQERRGMKRSVSEDEAYGPEYGSAEEGHGRRLDNLLAKLADLNEAQERAAKAREQLRVEAEKLLEALYSETKRHVGERRS